MNEKKESMEDILASIRNRIILKPIKHDYPDSNEDEDIIELKNALDEDVLTPLTENSPMPSANLTSTSVQKHDPMHQVKTILTQLETPPNIPNQTFPDGSKSLESFVGELISPILHQWLDQHLPTLVRAIVEENLKKMFGK